MTELIKKIAVNQLIQIKGKDFLIKNKGNFAISYQESGHQCIVTFLLSKSTKNNFVGNIDNRETPISKVLMLSINTVNNKCKVLQNTI